MHGTVETQDADTARVGIGRAWGTFGELLQGVLPEGDLDFLVTLPITRSSRVVFMPDPGGRTLTAFPPRKRKSRALARTLLEHLRLPPGGALVVDCELPEGKGLASSSADLVATARAIASAYRVTVPDSLLLDLMGAIEPSDGVMYDQAVAFCHRRVRLLRRLGPLPPLTIVAADEGGRVDTVRFNRLPKPFLSAHKTEYRQLLEDITAAVARGDPEAIGRVATRSAVLNQLLRPKRHLERIMALAQRVHGLGTVVAHSGTCLGVLLSPDDSRYATQLAAACRALQRLAGNVAVYHGRSSPAPCQSRSVS